MSHNGDWRRFKIVDDINYKIATINWENQDSLADTLTMKGLIQCGMEQMLTKIKSTSNSNFESITLPVL